MSIFKLCAPSSDMLLKQHMGGHQFYNSEQVEVAVCEWL
jgi:hypothetical protein